MSERAERLSGLQNGSVGSIAGMAEVMLQQPTVAIKNAVQQGRPISWSVPALYRGLGVSLASIAPISAIQFATNGRLLRGLTAPDVAPSDQTKLLCATLSGLASTGLSGPAELIMTLQQNNGKSFGATMTEASSQFVTMASTHLGVTPLNWYRQISLKCEASGRVKSWTIFKDSMRQRFTSR
ncbi:hypothetical protein PPTG_24082 [Phytophthora nicotianae INRA-310]|uniref:Uncharacterized protein n=1 Tax=Phytophthora nicotianae (strain INRA-310) TaxID=761204 RepID=W2PMX4_PHYN3|nr:hypothetical protein PPTG_24082 [Phytophthora nicotianae INRA-310]ETN01370.1 hypothetical protein PPTG_24082 [Phytophthora nicotianae INRA-310]